jgi:hypothetical protein
MAAIQTVYPILRCYVFLWEKKICSQFLWEIGYEGGKE